MISIGHGCLVPCPVEKKLYGRASYCMLGQFGNVEIEQVLRKNKPKALVNLYSLHVLFCVTGQVWNLKKLRSSSTLEWT
jgi:hypothetical protein